MRESGKSDAQIDEERINEAKKHGQKVIDIMYKFRPFYAPNIYPYLDKLTTLLLHEIIAVNSKDWALQKDANKYWDEGQKATKTMKELIESICVAIRERIYLNSPA